MAALGGHVWTIAPDLLDRVWPARAPADMPWSIDVADARFGVVRIGGRIRVVEGSDTLLVVVHGLGGSSESPYVRRAAIAALAHGWSCLRIDLRGADGRGEDYYHAGLSSDLQAALVEPRCALHRRVLVLGYSLGGHIALRLALDPGDPRVRGVAAVCAPLDLARSAAWIDQRRSWLYRSHVLRGLVGNYRAVAARRELPVTLAEVARVRTIREWDRLAVVPRHGFTDVDDYYARASVGPRLRELAVPSAWFGARHDPMVPEPTVSLALAQAGDALHVRWIERGGHVGFPRDAEQGGTLEAAVLRWLADQG
ncbi:MAG: alpha/beta fold hydrolase [Deltaproteobacteria bacterium]|nr:alpha/beta fold hydrolase [Nannocystaceae bacterium]